MDELLEIYKEKFRILDPVLKEYNEKQKSIGLKATNPFCIKLPDNFKSFKNRIMVFGQETNTWCNECGDLSKNNQVRSIYSNSLEKSLQIYDGFFFGGGRQKYGGPFWNEFNRIIKNVSNESDAVFSWNNIVKIGRIGKGNLDKINNINRDYFQVIKSEINIFSPSMLVFFTGPNYDRFIKEYIGEFEQKELISNVWEIHFKDEKYKDLKVIKTYHPNHLYFNKKIKQREVIKKIISEINVHCKN